MRYIQTGTQPHNPKQKNLSLAAWVKVMKSKSLNNHYMMYVTFMADLGVTALTAQSRIMELRLCLN